MDETLRTSISNYTKTRLAILCDDLKEPFRSYLIAPAQVVDRDLIALVLNLTGGLITVALSPERVRALGLSYMGRPQTSQSTQLTATSEMKFCTSVEAREGITSGISADDRAITVRLLGDDPPNQRQLVQPGHIFPVEAREGGVLVKAGPAEGAVDLARLLGCSDASLCTELLDARGDLMLRDGARSLASEKKLPFLLLSEVVEHRMHSETIIKKIAEAKLPTFDAGELRAIIYRSTLHSGEHVALVKGNITPEQAVLTRVQLEFTFGDVFGGGTPHSRKQIAASLRAIGAAPCGVILYLRRALAGQLRDQISNWHLKFTEKPASMSREYGIGSQILRDLGVRKLELLSDSKLTYSGLESFGLEIVAQRQLLG